MKAYRISFDLRGPRPLRSRERLGRSNGRRFARAARRDFAVPSQPPAGDRPLKVRSNAGPMRVGPALLICSELRVRDLTRSLRFYRALGLRCVARWTMQDGEELAWVKDPQTGQVVELYFVPRRSRFYSPFRRAPGLHTPLLFSLRDVRSVLPRLLRLGAKVVVDFEEREVRILFVRDLDGSLLELVGWTDSARRSHRAPPLRELTDPRPSHD